MPRFAFAMISVFFCYALFLRADSISSAQLPASASGGSPVSAPKPQASREDLKIAVSNLSKLPQNASLDLGVLSIDPDRDGVIEKRIRIVNQTGKPLTLSRLLPSCPCLSAHLQGGKNDKSCVIAVKGDVIVLVEIATAELPRGEFLRTLDIGFGKPAVTVMVTGRLGGDPPADAIK